MLRSANSIARPRLEKILRDALTASSLVILQAPFGYGKTTLIESALREYAETALFRAQPWHGGNFIEDLVFAVREVRPDFGRRTLAGADATLPAASLARLFTGDLRHVPSELILAIDNAEHLAGDASFAEFLDAAAHALPRHVRLLVSGRSVPALAAQTLVRNRAITIPADALLFSEEELGDALASHDIAASQETIERIARVTKGWPASVSLALGGGDIRAGADSDELGMQYVSEALLAALDQETQIFLERIAVFDRIDRRLFDETSQYGPFDSLIARLESAGTPIARDEFAYTLHPLVRSFALKQAAGSGTLSQAHAMAAQLYARHGNLAAALFHIVESGDERTADAFMREFGTSVVRTGNHEVIRRAMKLLTAPQTQDVRAYIDALLAKTGGGDATDRYLQTAAASSDARIAFGGRAEQIERSIARKGHADREALADLAVRAEELGVDARARAALFEAWSSAISFDWGAALETLEPFRAAGDTTTRFNTGVLYAYARASRGEVDAALEELDALVRLFENDDRVMFETLALVWQARIALLLGYTAIAGDAARAALRLMENLTIGAEEAALYFALTELATHEGSIAQTLAFADRLSGAAPRAWYSGDTARARAFAETALARAAFLGRDVATARDLALNSARNADFPLVQRATAYVEAAAYAALLGGPRASDLYDDAWALVREAEPRDTADAVALSTAIDVLAFLAGLHQWAATDSSIPQLAAFRALLDARRGLVTTAHAAIALRHLREGNATAEPFNAALAQIARAGPRFEVHLLRAFAPRDPITEPAAPPDADLTTREMEILSLLVEGLSNKEIAQRLIVSPRTVETHVERVLGKLEVGSRSRAIAKAIRLGLVELV